MRCKQIEIVSKKKNVNENCEHEQICQTETSAKEMENKI